MLNKTFEIAVKNPEKVIGVKAITEMTFDNHE